MRYPLFFFLLCCGLLFFSCVPPKTAPTCDPGVPTLGYSDGSCTPKLFTLKDLKGFPDNGKLQLAPTCKGGSDHARILHLEVPANAGDEVTLHLYNASWAYVSLTVYGSNDCGATAAPLNDCFSTRDVATTLTVSGLGKYKTILVRIDYSAVPGQQPYQPYRPARGEYISVAAYGKSPRPAATIAYNGYDPESKLEKLDVACDGRSFQRVVLVSCDPGADVDAWRREVGLAASEAYAGKGGAIVAAEVPPGMDPNTTGPALARRRPRQNTEDFSAEADYILTLPMPGRKGLAEAKDLDPDFNAVRQCLTFQPGLPSAEDRADNIVVTMIDGGFELGGERRKLVDRHLNRCLDAPYAPRKRAGYDFVRASADPEDEFGHGTTTGGALIGNYAGKRPLTVIHSKIFGYDKGFGTFGTYFGAVVATQVAGDIRSDFINMSFGLSPEKEPFALQCAIKYAISQGATIITSAGNDRINVDKGRPQWPAAFSAAYFPRLLSVTSWNYPRGGFPKAPPVRSVFANYGLSTTNLAAYLTARTPEYKGASGAFTYLAGTSISAPLFTAAAATQWSRGQQPGDLVASLPSSKDLSGAVQQGAYLPVCR